MLKITKYLTILLICFSLIIPTSSVRAFVANDSDNSFTFIDQNNNKITLTQESDGTIKQYLNDELTNSSKLDEKNNTIVEIEYDEGKQSNMQEINIDDMIADSNSTSPSYESTSVTYQQLDDLNGANLQLTKNSFPYSAGYSYVK